MYQLRGRLGRWGLGDIYEAVRKETGAVVMLKVVRGRRTSDPYVRRHMTWEYETSAAVVHGGVVRILSQEESPELGLYHVMDLLVGDTLGDQLKKGVTFLPEKAAAICVEVAEALVALHEAGRAHNELCPQAIFLPERPAGTGPDVKLINFGLPPATQRTEPRPQLPLEALPYAAPERRAGTHWDSSADVFSLCVVLLHLLVGKSPPPQGFRSLPALPAGASDLAKDLFETAGKGLNAEQSNRYATVAELRAELERCTRGDVQRPEARAVSSPPAGRPARKPAAMKKTILGVPAVVSQKDAADSGVAAAGPPTPAPVVQAQPTPAVQVQPSPVVQAQPTPAVQVQPSPVVQAQPSPTVQPTPAPTVQPQPTPTVQPTPAPAVQPQPTPTVQPTPAPAVQPVPPVISPASGPAGPAPTPVQPTPAPGTGPEAVPPPKADEGMPARSADPQPRKKKSAAHIRGKRTVLGFGALSDVGSSPPVGGPSASGGVKTAAGRPAGAVSQQGMGAGDEVVPVPALAPDELSADPLEGEPTVVADRPPLSGVQAEPGPGAVRPKARPPKAALLFTAGHTLKGEKLDDIGGEAPLDESIFSAPSSSTGSTLALQDDLATETEAVELVPMRRSRLWVWLAGLGVFLIGAGALSLALLEPWKSGKKDTSRQMAQSSPPAGAADAGSAPGGRTVVGTAGDAGASSGHRTDASAARVAPRAGQDAGASVQPGRLPGGPDSGTLEPPKKTTGERYREYLAEGRRAMRKRKYGLARKYFTKALNLRRGSFRARVYMAEAHYRAREYWAAVFWYKKLVEKSPRNVSIQVQLGKAYVKVGKRHMGCKHFLAAFRLRPNSKSLRRNVENYRCR